jgi:hypothetical protein
MTVGFWVGYIILWMPNLNKAPKLLGYRYVLLFFDGTTISIQSPKATAKLRRV